jgi:CHAT domain-containing protein/tetratricopeptide (TPR) repeat protein
MKRAVTNRATTPPVLVLVVVALLGGCSRRDEPPHADQSDDLVRAQRLFDEAEELRYRYEAADSRSAVEDYRAALEIWKQHGQTESACRAARAMGATHVQIGEMGAAIESYREALTLSRRANHNQLESEILAEIGSVHAMVGDLEPAARRCREALLLAQEAGGAAGEAEALLCLSEIDYCQGRLEAAADRDLQARSLWRSVADRRGEARAMLDLGMVRYVLSELDQAETCLTEAQQLWDALGDKRGRAQTLVAWGHLYERRGEYQSALNSFNEAKVLAEPMGDPVWQASLLDGIHSIYVKLAEYPDALAYAIQAQKLYEQAGLTSAVIDADFSIGEIHVAELDFGRALDRFERALSASEGLGDKRLSAWALNRIGLVYQSESESKKADLEKALEYYRRSLDLQRGLDDPRLALDTFGNQGVAYLALGQIGRALACFTTALELSRSAGDRLAESAALYNLARADRASGNIRAARRDLEASLETAEGLRAGVYSHLLRTSYLASIQRYYELYIDLLMDRSLSPGESDTDVFAFQVSERARARSLLDTLAEGGVDVRQGVDPALLKRERQLKQRIDVTSERRDRVASASRSPAEAEELAEQLRKLSADYDQVQAEIRSRSPRYAALSQPNPLNLAEVQQRILGEETLLLEYSLGEERSFLWAVECGNHVTFEIAPRSEIEKLSRDVYGLLTARIPTPGESVREYRLRVKDADSRYWETAGRLSEILLGPVRDRLVGKRIVVVSDGSIQYVPFSALPVPGGTTDRVPLIVSNEIVNLPSVSALDVLRQHTRGRRAARGSVAVLADPVFELDDPRVGGRPPTNAAQSPVAGLARSPRNAGALSGSEMRIQRMIATRREADSILATAPAGKTLRATDFAASRALAMDPTLGRFRIVHFATHGVVNNEQPGLSGVILSMVDEGGRPRNGFLRLHDIYNLNLPVDLVVLSACESALGKPVDGEGLIGIVRGFMTAGARSVVASLWKVDDEATGELMSRFYREMLKENRPPAAALRNAQIAMWRQQEWKPPFYWAAFVLQGEWL